MKLLITLLGLVYGVAHAQTFDLDSLEHFHSGNSKLQHNGIHELFTDSEGSMWIAGDHCGLYRYRDGEFTHFPFKDTLNYWFRDIEEDDKGNLLLCGYHSDIVTFNIHTETWGGIPFPGNMPWTIGKNHKGTFLIGVSAPNPGGQLFQYKDGQFTTLETDLPDAFSIMIQDNGDAYVSYRELTRLYKMQPDGSYTSEPMDFCKHAWYNSVTDSSGTIWSAAYTGLNLKSYDHRGMIEYPEISPDIKRNHAGKMRYVIYKTSVSPDNRPMVGMQFTLHFAILGKDGQSWELYQLKGIVGHFVADGISVFHWDQSDGSLWIGSWRNGLYHLHPKLEEKHIDDLEVMLG